MLQPASRIIRTASAIRAGEPPLGSAYTDGYSPGISMKRVDSNSATILLHDSFSEADMGSSRPCPSMMNIGQIRSAGDSCVSRNMARLQAEARVRRRRVAG